jgi:ureidoacrylate peracid hydrolase
MAAAQRDIVLEARPHSVTLDCARTAVIVVDMQNDFGAEGGMFARAGIDISGIQAAVAPTARVLAAARQAGIPVIYLKMGFQEDLSDAGGPASPNWIKHMPLNVGERVRAPDGSESRVLVRETWNSEIVPQLKPEPGDALVWKTRFSGFFETDLHELLSGRGVRHLIVTGCTTSVCVESTIRDAMFRDYHCVLLEDCTAEPIGSGLSRSNHEASILTIEILFGWISRSENLIAALGGALAPVRE